VILDFGQPLGGIAQFAYVVEDLEREMQLYLERLGLGPWFVRGPFTPRAARYRGQPAAGSTFSLAKAFAGHAMIELIVQHDDTPSVFNERTGPGRYGFHHWALLTKAFDADVARYLALGYAEAFFDELPSGARVMYVDHPGELPGMIELVEHNEAQERAYTEIYLAAVGWDGSDPIRHQG
jgi:hypothetical protein